MQRMIPLISAAGQNLLHRMTGLGAAEKEKPK